MESERIHVLRVPRWGMTMTEATLQRWILTEGQEVTAGAAVAELETEKAAADLESDRAGTLRRCLALEGDVLEVGAPVGLIADPSITDDELDAFLVSLQSADVEPDS